MKIRTWEKWYWGVDLAIMILALIGYHTNNSPKNYTVTINGKTRPMTGTEVYVGSFILFIGVAGLLWLIIRYFDKDKREREIKIIRKRICQKFIYCYNWQKSKKNKK